MNEHQEAQASSPDRSGSPGWSVGRVLGLAAGSVPIAYGIRGALTDLPDEQITSFVRWFVGGALVHDLVLGPLALAVAAVIARVLPRPVRAPVGAGAFASLVLVVVSWPFLVGDGRTSSEPSFLSRDYGRSLWWSLALTWSIVAVVSARRWWSHRSPPTDRSATGPRAGRTG